MAKRMAIVNTETNRVVNIHVGFEPPAGHITVDSDDAEVGDVYDPKKDKISIGPERKAFLDQHEKDRAEKIKEREEKEQDAADRKKQREDKEKKDRQEAAVNAAEAITPLQERLAKIEAGIGNLKDSDDPKDIALMETLKDGRDNVAQKIEKLQEFVDQVKLEGE